MSDAMSAEFDTVAEWTADVARELGPEFFVPAGCRGSGGPATLDPLLARLGAGASTRMLDVGAGVGGPAGHARATVGVRPVLAEPEAGACRAARRLFALPTVRADAFSLPFPDARFEVVWSLGVLCTTSRHRRILREIRRVLAPGGRAGLLVYVAQGELPEAPEGNDFPTDDELVDDVRRAGLVITDAREMSSADGESRSWRERSAAVKEAMQQRHEHDPAYEQAEDQAGIMGRLLAGRHVVGRVLTTVREDQPRRM